MSTSHFGFHSESLPTASTAADDSMLMHDTTDPVTDMLQPQPVGFAETDASTATGKLIQTLTQWWINEKTAPAVLQFQFEVVEPLADFLLERVCSYTQ